MSTKDNQIKLTSLLLFCFCLVVTVRNMVLSLWWHVISLKTNLAGCTEKVGDCLVSSDRNLDCQAVWHVDTHQHVCGNADTVPNATLRGRHGVDVGEHVQPLLRGGEKKWGKKRGYRGQAALDGEGRTEQRDGMREVKTEGGVGERAHKSIQFH